MAKTHTSSEVKARWINKAYKRYILNLRYDSDQQLIDFMENNKEKYGTTPILRDALEMYMKSGTLDD